MNKIGQKDTQSLIDISKAWNIIWLAFFGSVARGDDTEKSDVDLAVRFGKPLNLFEIVNIQMLMEAALGRSVDLIPIDDAYPFVRESMRDDLVVLYEDDKHNTRITEESARASI